jgi:2'-5' RNA ligase
MDYAFYHFILPIPDHVDVMVRKLKNEAKRVIGNYPSMYAKPHITINNYPRKPENVDVQGFSFLSRKLNLMPPTVFEIDGFDCFNESNDYNKTIFARLKLTPQNKYWLKLLKASVGDSSTIPHITIARAVNPEQFYRLWPHFQKRELNVKFVVNRLTILKNLLLDIDQHAKVYREFEFRGSENELTGLDNLASTRQFKNYPSINQQISLF